MRALKIMKNSFLLLLLVEIAGFILVGKLLGVLLTLLLILGTSILGFTLLRRQGMAAAYDGWQQMQQGRMYTAMSAQQMLLMLAAILLIIPGFLTDLCGLLLLLPPVRNLIEAWLQRKGMNFDAPPPTAGAGRVPHQVIEGQFRHEDDS